METKILVDRIQAAIRAADYAVREAGVSPQAAKAQLRLNIQTVVNEQLADTYKQIDGLER
jgi:hypothetical protein